MPSTDGVCAFLEGRLCAGMVVLDIGANEGAVTDVAARLVGPAGHVLAVEPFPASAAAIAARHDSGGPVSVVEAAVCDQDGETALYLDAERSTRHSLWPDARLVPGGSITVRTIRLDSLRPTLPPVDVVKIDAQGAESSIVRGGRDLLTFDQPLVIFELWRKGLKVSKTDGWALLDELASLGYHFHPVNARGTLRSDGRIQRFLREEGKTASLNIVAHPRRWPAGRWRHVVPASGCVIAASPRATCRPWRRAPASVPRPRVGWFRMLWRRWRPGPAGFVARSRRPPGSGGS